MNKPLKITFDEILKLMRQCEHVDKLNVKSQRRNRGDIIKEQDTNLQSSIFPKSPLSLLNGIIPGGSFLLFHTISNKLSIQIP